MAEREGTPAVDAREKAEKMLPKMGRSRDGASREPAPAASMTSGYPPAGQEHGPEDEPGRPAMEGAEEHPNERA